MTVVTLPQLSPGQAARYAVLLWLDEAVGLEVDGEADRLKTELWCLREGIDPREFPNETLASFSTGMLLTILLGGVESPNEVSSKVLCTIWELLG